MTLLFYSFSSVFFFSFPSLSAWNQCYRIGHETSHHFFLSFFPLVITGGVGVCFVMSELLMDRVDGLDQSAVS